MRKVSSALAFGVCLMGASHAMAADKISLNSGDMLSGKVLSYSAHSLELQTKYGALNIPKGDIAKIEAADQSVAVTMGFASPEAIAPQAGDAKEEGGLWGAKWKGNANLGAQMKTGNSDTSAIAIDAQTSARWEKHRANFEADYNYEEDNDNTTVDDREISAAHDYFFKPRWFFSNELSFEQDKIDEIDLRTTISSGLGYQAYEQDDLNLKYVLGLAYVGETFEDDTSDDNIATRWALDYDQKFNNDTFRLFHDHEISAPFDDFGAFLFQSESGVRIPLKKGIIASAQVDFDWDNDPAEGVTEEDTTYSLKLGYEW